MYYEVGPEATKFTNKFLAAYNANARNLSMRFNLYEHAFDSVDWSRDPNLNWNQLLDIRARQIEAKNKPIVLYFSGGTDSYTIYRVFERNQIPLTAIYLRKRPDLAEGTWDKVHELFNSGLYRNDTKIIIDDDYAKSLATAYDSQDWLWNGGLRQFFGMIGPDSYTYNYIKNVLGRDDFISVIGYEKPRLKITENAVYSYQDDDNYNKIMPMSGADCFFISPELPELHVKQSYMMLNYIKSQCPWATSPRDVMHYDNLSSTLVFNWYDYSIKASGRFGDLARSDLQHQGNDRSRMVVPMSGKFNGTEVMGRSAKWFQDFYKTDKDTFNNFTNGYMSVLNDPYCGLLQQDTNVFNLKHFYSKMYQMTF